TDLGHLPGPQQGQGHQIEAPFNAVHGRQLLDGGSWRRILVALGGRMSSPEIETRDGPEFRIEIQSQRRHYTRAGEVPSNPFLREPFGGPRPGEWAEAAPRMPGQSRNPSTFRTVAMQPPMTRTAIRIKPVFEFPVSGDRSGSSGRAGFGVEGSDIER